MDDQYGLKDEPNLQRIPTRDYLALSKTLLLITVVGIIAMLSIQSLGSQGIIFYTIAVMSASLFGFTGLLLTDLIPAKKEHTPHRLHPRR